MADKFSRFPLVGSIISAIIASICCIGPVILAILGLGGAGLFSKFGSFRPYLIGVTAILLGLAFYLTYRKREVLCEDGTCKIKGASRWNKIALWVATGLIAFLIAFPYLNLSNQNSANNQTGGEIVELTLFVEGMTCSGCEFNVENAVGKLDGIIKVKANYQKGDVYVKFEKDKVTVDKIVEAINKSVYRATKQ
ncbi:MAG: mercuric transporter MerT family protein [Caldisericum exile]|uniref:mercuric transporter MerT family protein n=1 Tax=Caldisericum exile TaxID=693075 RepID=UPI003C734BC1